jgi:hypothetical protein
MSRRVLRAHAENYFFFLTRDFLQCYGHLAVSLRGVILSERMSLPVFGHEDATQIRMALEVDSEQVIDLALEGVGARPDRHDGGHSGVVTRKSNLEAEALPRLDRIQMVNCLETRFVGIMIERGNVRKIIEEKAGHVAQELTGPYQTLRPDEKRHFIAKYLSVFNRPWV